MWIVLALLSALTQGFYEVSKKEAVAANNVLLVLTLNVLMAALIMSPVVVGDMVSGMAWPGGNAANCLFLVVKSVIVLSSWALGYVAIRDLPLTIAGPINAARPVLVLAGSILLFGEQLSLLQWAGMILGFVSLYLSATGGSADGFSLLNSRNLWLAIVSMVMGAASGLYDKFLLQRIEPSEVQAWYSLFQCLIMCGAVAVAHHGKGSRTPFRWRWAILLVPVFHTLGDYIYFHALSYPDSMVSVVAMIQRGSVLVTFIYGAVVYRERHLKAKAIDLAILFLGLVLIVLGS